MTLLPDHAGAELQAVFQTWMVKLPLREHIEKNTTTESLLRIISEQYNLPESRCELKHCGESMRPMQILLQQGVRPSLHDKGHILQLYLKPTEEEEYMKEHKEADGDALGKTKPDGPLSGLLDDLESLGDKLVDGAKDVEMDTAAESTEALPPMEATPTGPRKPPAKPEDVIKKVFHPSQLPRKKEEIDYDAIEAASAVPPISVDQFVLDGPLATFRKPSRSVVYEATDEEGVEVVVKGMHDPLKFQMHREYSQALKRLRREREAIEGNGGLLPDGEPAEKPNPCTEAHVHVVKDLGFFRDSSATYPAAEEERRRRARRLLVEAGEGEEEEPKGPLFIVQERGEHSLEAWLETHTPTEVELLALAAILSTLSAFFHRENLKRAELRSAPKACQVDIPLSNVVWFPEVARRAGPTLRALPSP